MSVYKANIETDNQVRINKIKFNPYTLLMVIEWSDGLITEYDYSYKKTLKNKDGD